MVPGHENAIFQQEIAVSLLGIGNSGVGNANSGVGIGDSEWEIEESEPGNAIPEAGNANFKAGINLSEAGAGESEKPGNVADHRPRASEAPIGTATSSRGSVHLLCSALHSCQKQPCYDPSDSSDH